MDGVISMKQILCMLMFVAFLLAGCNQPVDSVETIQARELSNLVLKENQSYFVYDYVEDQLLLLVYDTKKRDLAEEESLQAPAKYCYKFVLYDISKQKIIEEFSIEQFGHCLSAIYAYDGVLLTWVSNDGEMEPASSISFINQQGIKKVCDLAITKFSLGPLLRRSGGEVIFSYANELTDGEFGVKKMTRSLNVEPLLTFTPDQADYMSDDIVASNDHYTYAVGEQGQVSIYIGSAKGEHVKIRLQEGENLCSLGITSDWIVISKNKAPTDGGGYCLERFDLQENSVELYTMNEPLYFITGTDSNRFCGFTPSTPIKLFAITDAIEAIEVDRTNMDGAYQSALSNGDSFVLTGYDQNNPRIWLIS